MNLDPEDRTPPIQRSEYRCPRGVVQLEIRCCKTCGAAMFPHEGAPVVWVCVHCRREES